MLTPSGHSAAVQKVARVRRVYQPTRIHHTRAYKKKRMASVEEENVRLQEEVSTLREEVARLSAAMAKMMTTQEQTTVIQPVIPETPQPTPEIVDPRYTMPPGHPWGLPPFLLRGTSSGGPEIQIPNQSQGLVPQGGASISQAIQAPEQPTTVCHPSGITMPQVTATFANPMVHATPQFTESGAYGGNMHASDPLVELRKEILGELRQEIGSARGKEVLGIKTQELCLVPNVEIPHKFKTPDFEKYKGVTCPEKHVIKFVRKMSNHIDNHALMIHCFQDSLAADAADWYSNLKRSDIHTFDDLAKAFMEHYDFNTKMRLNREHLRAYEQKKDETFREYAQRWRAAAARIVPPLDNEEMTQIFLKTLNKSYIEKMIVGAPSTFTDMVTMGTRLEEAVREGYIVLDNAAASSNNTKKFGNGHHKKKEQDVGMVSIGGNRPVYPTNHQVANIPPATPNHARNHPPRPQNQYQLPPPPYPYQPYPQPLYYPSPYQPLQYPQPPQYPQQQQTRPPPQQQQNRPPTPHQQNRPRPQFPPIPMTYAALLPSLLAKGHCQLRQAPPPPDPMPANFRADLTCDFHSGGMGHDVENCYALKYIVKRLIDGKQLTFSNDAPNAQVNPLPNHEAAVSMVEDCDGIAVLSVQHIQTPLVPLHMRMCQAAMFNHNHLTCEVCPWNPQGCQQVQDDIQSLLDKKELVITRKNSDVCVITPVFHDPQVEEVAHNVSSAATPLVIFLPGPVPHASSKAIPYRYTPTMLDNGVEVPLVAPPTVDNIAEASKILRNGRVIPTIFPKKTSGPVINQSPVNTPNVRSEIGQSSGTVGKNTDFDEVLKLIKKSDYKIVDQLLQTPSKISVLSLLLNSEAHRNALMRVLEQAYVDHEVTVDQFGGIVGNITSCNNLSFSDEELPEAGRNHNLALHISVNCKSDTLSNVLVDTGSSLNVMSKTTLDQLSYRGAPMRRSGFLVKAFDGSRKTVIAEVDLPITIGPQVFQVTFQIMDIQASYSCLLGRPWIHEAGAVTSTLHQKLKFVKEGKLVTVNGEEALLVSHLSSFSFIEADSTEGTSFQGLVAENDDSKKVGASMASLKDAQKAVQEGQSAGWGKLIQFSENRRKEGLGFFPSASFPNTNIRVKPIDRTFQSAGFLNAIIEDGPDEVVPAFVTPGGSASNWDAVDVPSVMHVSK